MARFEIEVAKVLSEDGEDREYTVIADRSTFEWVDAPFGRVQIGRGFIRCHGRHYIGTFGRETPVYGGTEDDTYYAPMGFFDGDWDHAGPNSRGLFDTVTKSSGTGKLFAELEAFCEASQIPVSY